MKHSICTRQLLNIAFFAIVFDLPLTQRIGASFDRLILILQIIILLICTLFLFSTKKVVIDSYIIVLLLFAFWAFLVVFIFTESGSIYIFITSVVYPILSVYLLCNYILYEDYRLCIKIIAKYYAIVIWVNCFLMVAFPKGLITSSIGAVESRANWLFGSKNTIISILPIVLFFFGLDRVLNKPSFKHKHYRRLTFVIMFASFASMGTHGVELLSGSMTAVFMILLYVSFELLISCKIGAKLLRMLSIKRLCIFSILIMILIISISQGKALSSSSILHRAIAFSGKDIGFSGRYSAWREALIALFKSPLYGIGLKQQIFITYDNPKSTNISIYSFWLSLAVRYGIIGFVLIVSAFSHAEVSNKFPCRAEIYICFIILMIGGLTYPLEWRYVLLLVTVVHFCEMKNCQEKSGGHPIV